MLLDAALALGTLALTSSRTMKVILVLALVACGGKPPPASTPGSTPATAVLPDVPFDKLDHEQRAAFMKQKVVPMMMPIFQAHDAKMFADFGCKTCHGKEVDDGHFDMPNGELPLISKATMPKYKPADVEWMAKQVKPTMAKLLQQPEWDASHPDGFGCHGCHPTEE